jgi:NAD(P)-dependent dehydrogenase (short-subunit alcohol dehydrogenase family)
MRIEGAVVLVTGAASGLGQATANRLTQAGAKVVQVDRLASSTPNLETLSHRAPFCIADVTDPSAFDEALDVAEAIGPLRAVVHCAGRGGDRQRVLSRDGIPADASKFAEVLRVNLVGSFNVLSLAAARMSKNHIEDGDRGCILLTTSVAAFEGQIGQASYAASKAGVHGMTLVAARDLANWGIRVNTIAPGIFDTEMLGRISVDVRARLEAAVPHPARLGDAKDYAHMAISIIESEYINGETVRLDGALRMAPR